MPRRTSARNLTFFLRQLELTCNMTLAAERSGLAKSGIHKRKRRDPEFAAACEAALAAHVSSPERGGGPSAKERMVEGARSQSTLTTLAAHVSSPERGGGPRSGGGDRMETLLTTPGDLIPSRYAGIPQLRRLPEGRLTGFGVANFFAALANTGNIRLAARAVGVAASSIHARRRTDPAFAEEMDAALDIALSNIECALIQAADRTFDPEWSEGIDPDGPRMSIGQMISFLSIVQRRES